MNPLRDVVVSDSLRVSDPNVTLWVTSVLYDSRPESWTLWDPTELAAEDGAVSEAVVLDIAVRAAAARERVSTMPVLVPYRLPLNISRKRMFKEK